MAMKRKREAKSGLQKTKDKCCILNLHSANSGSQSTKLDPASHPEISDPDGRRAPRFHKRIVHPEGPPAVLPSHGASVNDLAMLSLLKLDWTPKDIEAFQEKFHKFQLTPRNEADINQYLEPGEARTPSQRPCGVNVFEQESSKTHDPILKSLLSNGR
ncbi:hypothetical protein OEA41_009221 [Lepraria neglecta]|uniref:Uncharacterized protein n=1 Tax=Lepraria neglecta TaxID=209136 RepID=A0AAD9Z4H0_9LECA|nr:hypothetical protein OEA41_009221 [Lepraria neglecta]